MARAVCILTCCLACVARADESPGVVAVGAPAANAGALLGGYVESFYQWNLDRPANGVTNFRGFDNRHDAFTISNAVLDAQWDQSNVVGRLALQVGHTPSTYYLAEPARAGTAGANGTGSELWKYLQQAYGGYRFDVGRGLVVHAGLFLSPIGPETIPVLETWNWSRSHLFFGLPYYHSGVRAMYGLTDAWSLEAWLVNGWNSVVDNNRGKSLALRLVRTAGGLQASVIYFGGPERPEGAPEGQPWRHLLDAHVTWSATERLSVQGHANAGFEAHRLGTSWWWAAAAAARLSVTERAFFTLRGDVFTESAPAGASRIFWPVDRVASVTATLERRLGEKAAVRLEYRHDAAAGALYFGPGATGGTPDRTSQDTLTGGLAAGF
jgi:hypothetical protein